VQKKSKNEVENSNIQGKMKLNKRSDFPLSIRSRSVIGSLSVRSHSVRGLLSVRSHSVRGLLSVRFRSVPSVSVLDVVSGGGITVKVGAIESD
jgi:hypothetical protein